jgi:hypothetical protein
MSRISFDTLISEHPESKRALRKLQGWMKEHQDAEVIYPSVLGRELSGIDAVALAKALMLLEKAGILRRVYKVEERGVLTDAEFDDPRDIPEKLPGRGTEYFETAESEIVPVFHKVAAG